MAFSFVCIGIQYIVRGSHGTRERRGTDDG